MTGAIFLGLAVTVDVGAALLSWSQARRAAASTGEAPAALAVALKRLPAGERLAELRRRTPPASLWHELASEALDAPDEPSRVGTVNSALAEVEHTLTAGASWPRSGVRITLLASALLAVAAFLVEGSFRVWSLSILALGGVSVLTCWEAGRAARRNAASQRRAVDELIAAVFGDAARFEQGAIKRPSAASRASARTRRRYHP